VRENKLWNHIDALREQLAQADRRIAELEKENDAVRAKYQALHRKQFKARRRKSKERARASREDSPGAPAPGGPHRGKPRGAPVGHPGWSRPKPTHIDQSVEVPAPQVCPHCRSTHLTPIDDVQEHLQEDIVLQPRTFVTRFRHRQAYCQACRRAVIRAAPDELPKAPIGPVAKSTAIYLRYAMGLSYRKVHRLFEHLFGLKFVPASALGFDRQAAAKGRPLYEDLREKIQASALVHADETSWRQDGESHWVWFAGNRDLALFHIDKHRSTDVAQSILGSNFGGVLLADGYAAYNGVHPLARQSCLAHIIRHAKETLEELRLRTKPSRDRTAQRFCSKIAAFFSKVCDVARKLLAGVLDRKRAPLLEARLGAELEKICARKLASHKAETLRTRLLGPERHRLFTFLRYPEVPPTNNHAEQSLRFLVIFRKLTFGTRSELGSLTHSILASLVATARRQGRDPRRFLQTLLTTDTPTSQAALYGDPS